MLFRNQFKILSNAEITSLTTYLSSNAPASQLTALINLISFSDKLW